MESKAHRTEVAGESLLERLNRNPDIKARVERLLDLVENAGGDLKRADEAEQRAIDELRAMGQELLGAWGQRLADRESAGLARQGKAVHQVKKLRWHSTFGEIEVCEQVFRQKSDGHLIRPFAIVAGVTPFRYNGRSPTSVLIFPLDGWPTSSGSTTASASR